MDLTAIAKTIWRHKLVTLPIIALMFILAVYQVKLKAPVYQADASYILINPPNPPTAEQIAANPALGKLNSNNQLVGYGNLNIIVDLLAERLDTNAERQLLVAKGADSRYTIAPNTTYLSAPIMDIVGVGSTAAEAMNSAKLVGDNMVSTLNSIQTQQGTSPKYWITAQQLAVPNRAQTQLSSRLRSLIAVLAVGIILLFVAVSTMNGVAERRRAAKADKAQKEQEQLAADWDAGMGLENGDHSPLPDLVRVAESDDFLHSLEHQQQTRS
jgi:hypothetical protein